MNIQRFYKFSTLDTNMASICFSRERTGEVHEKHKLLFSKWNLSFYNELLTYSLPNTQNRSLIAHRPYLTSVAFNRSGGLLACGSTNGRLQIFKISSMETQALLNTGRIYGNDLSKSEYSPPGQWWHTGLKVESVRWNLLCDSLLACSFASRKDIHIYDITRCVASASGDRIDTDFIEKPRILLEASSGSGIFDFTFIPGTKTRVIGSGRDGYLRIWDLNCTSKPRREVDGGLGSINTLQISRDGLLLYAGSEKGLIGIWDLRNFHSPLRVLSVDTMLRDYHQSQPQQQQQQQQNEQITTPTTQSELQSLSKERRLSTLQMGSRNAITNREECLRDFSNRYIIQSVQSNDILEKINSRSNVVSLCLDPANEHHLAFQLRGDLQCGLVDLYTRKLIRVFNVANTAKDDSTMNHFICRTTACFSPRQSFLIAPSLDKFLFVTEFASYPKFSFGKDFVGNCIPSTLANFAPFQIPTKYRSVCVDHHPSKDFIAVGMDNNAIAILGRK